MQAVRAADDERHIAPLAHPVLHLCGKLPGGRLRAALVQRDTQAVLRQGGENALRFRLHDLRGGLAGAARFRLDFQQLASRLARHPFGVLVEARRDPVRHFVANGYNDELHPVSYKGTACRAPTGLPWLIWAVLPAPCSTTLRGCNNRGWRAA